MRRSLLALSIAGWALLVTGPSSADAVAYCLSPPFAQAGWAGLRWALAVTPPATLAAGWLVMLIAMMPPLLERPLLHVWERTFSSRRPCSIALFAVGYFGVWMAFGALLVPFALFVRGATPAPMALLASACLALLWQVSPWKQACLNRCHRLPPLPASGLAADGRVLFFGAGHGFWCAAACGPLMAVPMLLPGGHTAGMALMAVFLFAERLEPPAVRRWRLRWPNRGLRSQLDAVPRTAGSGPAKAHSTEGAAA